MKQIIFLLTWLPVILAAQPYRLIDPQSIYLYDDLNYAIRIDRVETWAKGYQYHNYEYADLCYDGVGLPEWFDQPLIIDTVAGRYTFFNNQGDSIHWYTQTQVDEAWPMVWLGDSSYLEAKHDSTRRIEVFGQFDSVRFYSLQAIDTLGQALTHPWNDSTLRLSDAHGMLTTFAPDQFPHEAPRLFELKGMENPDLGEQGLTPREIWSMPVGSEIQTLRYSFHHSGRTPFTSQSWRYRKIVPIERQDFEDSLSISFQVQTVTISIIVNSLNPYEIDSVFSQDLDTVFQKIIYPDRLAFPYERSEDIGLYAHGHSNLNCSLGNRYVGGKRVLVTRGGYSESTQDTCWEAHPSSSNVCAYALEGLGGWYDWQRYSGSTGYQHDPYYYAFPDDTAGTPINFDSLLAIVTHLESPQSSPLRVYPNPARDQLFIREVPAGWIDPQVMLLDLTGRVVRQAPLTEEAVDLRGLPGGMYVLQVSAQGQWRHRSRIFHQP